MATNAEIMIYGRLCNNRTPIAPRQPPNFESRFDEFDDVLVLLDWLEGVDVLL